MCFMPGQFKYILGTVTTFFSFGVIIKRANLLYCTSRLMPYSRVECCFEFDAHSLFWLSRHELRSRQGRQGQHGNHCH